MTTCLRCLTHTVVAAVAVVIALALYVWPQGCCWHPKLLKDASEVAKRCPERSRGFSGDDLQGKGFTVLPDFLSEGEVERSMELWASLPDDASSVRGAKGGVKGIGPQQLSYLWDKIRELVDTVQDTTDVYVGREPTSNRDCFGSSGTYVVNGQFFHTNSSNPDTPVLGWHQDGELGIKHPDAYNHLSLYIFLDKPVPHNAGLSLIPFDSILEMSPELHNYLKGSASRDFMINTKQNVVNHVAGFPKVVRQLKTYKSDNVTTLIDITHDSISTFPGSLDHLECTPELKAGDAVLFRGDTIHRTQGHFVPISWRTSMNVRLNPIRVKPLSRYLKGGLRKATMQYYVPQNYLSEEMCSSRVARGEMCNSFGSWKSSCHKVLDKGTYVLLKTIFAVDYWVKFTLFTVRKAMAWLSGDFVAALG